MRTLCYLILPAAALLVMRPDRGQKQGAPDASQFSVLGVTIGRDDITSLRTKLGPVQKCHTRSHVEIAGYRNADQEVIFEFGEVGGGHVTSFYLRPRVGRAECPESRLPDNISQISTEGRIHIGMTEDEFGHILGPPHAKTKEGEWKYSWEWEEPLTDQEKKRASIVFPGANVSEAEVSVTVRAKFSEHILRYFYISRLEVL